MSAERRQGEAPVSGRRFSEEEFALILRTAVEIQAQRGASGTTVSSADGSSLEEIQAIAREVGIDPGAVAEAASQLVSTRGAEKGLLTTHYLLSDSVPGQLTAEGRVAVLQAIREAAAHHGDADVSGPGVEWSGPTGDTTRFQVSVYDLDDVQEVRLSVDQKATAILTHFLPTMVGFIASMAVGASLSPSSAWVGAAIVAGGVGSGLAVGRTLWRASTLKARERAERILVAARSALQRESPEADS